MIMIPMIPMFIITLIGHITKLIYISFIVGWNFKWGEYRFWRDNNVRQYRYGGRERGYGDKSIKRITAKQNNAETEKVLP